MTEENKQYYSMQPEIEYLEDGVKVTFRGETYKLQEMNSSRFDNIQRNMTDSSGKVRTQDFLMKLVVNSITEPEMTDVKYMEEIKPATKMLLQKIVSEMYGLTMMNQNFLT